MEFYYTNNEKTYLHKVKASGILQPAEAGFEARNYLR